MKIGILGYGALGKAIENEAVKRTDLEIAGIFSDLESSDECSGILHTSQIYGFIGMIDALIICEKKEKDDPFAYAGFAEYFNTVDSYIGNGGILEYFSEVDHAAKSGRNSSVVSSRWMYELVPLYRACKDMISLSNPKNNVSEIKNGKTTPAMNAAESTENFSDTNITAKIMLTYARAAYKQRIFGYYGAFTVFDFRLKELFGLFKCEPTEQFIL